MSNFLNDSVFTLAGSPYENVNAQERSFLSPNQLGGRVRAVPFYYESASTTAVDTIIPLAVLPKNAKILHVHVAHEALSGGAGTSQADIGLYTMDGTAVNATAIADDLSVEAAGTQNYYPIDATVGADSLQTTAQNVLAVKAVGELWAANAYFKGFVLYVENS